jgi:hypothetical protein
MFATYDREELYQKVWEKPMLKVAEEYGVSDVALAKVCRKLSVPLPGRGYWAKLAHGHAVPKKPALPNLDEVPVIYRSEQSQQKQNKKPDPSDSETATIEELLRSGALVPPAIDPSKEPHVLIRSTASRLRSQSRKTDEGILLPREPGGLDVRVTAKSLGRALQVLAKVLAVLDGQAIKVEVLEQGGTVASIEGCKIAFGVEEPVRKVVTQKPRVPNPTDKWDYDRIVTFESSGQLVLSIHSSSWETHGLRQKWSDAKTRRVESLIPDFIAGMMRTALVLRRAEEDRIRHENERQKRERDREELRKLVAEEERKLEQFNQWMDNFESAERMRRFIAAYAEKTSSRSPEKQPNHREWIEWANQQADRLDPFVAKKPASVLDRKNEIRGS